MKSLIDYLSFTWCPAELGQIIELARMGASLKRLHNSLECSDDDFGVMAESTNNKSYPVHIVELTSSDIAVEGVYKPFSFQSGEVDVMTCGYSHQNFDVSKELRCHLSESEFVVGEDSRKFHEVKRDLLDHFGLNTVDALCHGEVDRFVNRLNFGLGLNENEWTYSLRPGGFSGYPHSANILVNGQQAGLCAWGAKNHGCYVSFSGAGCVALDMLAMQEAIQSLPGAKITRLDIAYDDLAGKKNIDTARELAEEGQFITRGRPCSYSYIESGHMAKVCDYVKESGNTESLKKRYGMIPSLGRSFYVGSRDAGKMLRVYEKGKQLKSEQYPDWVRWELELRSKDRVIPFDALTSPDKYIAGAYPALAHICEDEQCTIATHKRTYLTSVENAVKNGSTQCGKLVNYMRHCLGLTAEQVVHQLTNHLEFHEIPDRLNTPIYQDSAESEEIKTSEMMVLHRNGHQENIFNRLALADFHNKEEITCLV
ncbi:replication initiation factor domain-containing protein [Photobacterium alginatilyticum]|nr:replication initiation factor domain-containing protein [Photobacterium alginatilyticum]